MKSILNVLQEVTQNMFSFQKYASIGYLAPQKADMPLFNLEKLKF